MQGKTRSPMFWQVTNLTDGSQHLLLGTLHAKFSLTEVFPNKFLELLAQANILIGEAKYKDHDESYSSFDPVLSHIRRRQYNLTETLTETLGIHRVRKLQAMFADTKHAGHRYFGQFAIQASDVVWIIQCIQRLGQVEAASLLDISFDQQMILDRQIPVAARAASGNKTQFVGLETLTEGQDSNDRFYSVATKTLNVEDPGGEWGIEQLRTFIDAGGIDQERARYFWWVDDFLKGRLMRYDSPDKWWWPPVTRDQHIFELVDQRNRAWIATQKIQDSCVEGNKCLIYVGVSHVFYHTAPLTSLLRNEGFAVEVLTPDGFSNFNF